MHRQLAPLCKHRLQHGLQHHLLRLRLLPLRPVCVGNPRVDVIALPHQPVRKPLDLVLRAVERRAAHLRDISRQQWQHQRLVRHAIAVPSRPKLWRSRLWPHHHLHRRYILPNRNHIERIRLRRCRCRNVCRRRRHRRSRLRNRFRSQQHNAHARTHHKPNRRSLNPHSSTLIPRTSNLRLARRNHIRRKHEVRQRHACLRALQQVVLRQCQRAPWADVPVRVVGVLVVPAEEHPRSPH